MTPKWSRRDLLRKRSQLNKTMVVGSLPSLVARLTGQRVSLNRIHQLTPEGVRTLVSFPEQGPAGRAFLDGAAVPGAGGAHD